MDFGIKKDNLDDKYFQCEECTLIQTWDNYYTPVDPKDDCEEDDCDWHLCKRCAFTKKLNILKEKIKNINNTPANLQVMISILDILMLNKFYR